MTGGRCLGEPVVWWRVVMVCVEIGDMSVGDICSCFLFIPIQVPCRIVIIIVVTYAMYVTREAYILLVTICSTAH